MTPPKSRKCMHDAWEEYGSSRKCADCGEHLGAVPMTPPDLLARLRGEREKHAAYTNEEYATHCKCGLRHIKTSGCPTARALDCAIAGIEESEARLTVETREVHTGILAAMLAAYEGKNAEE